MQMTHMLHLPTRKFLLRCVVVFILAVVGGFLGALSYDLVMPLFAPRISFPIPIPVEIKDYGYLTV